LHDFAGANAVAVTSAVTSAASKMRLEMVSFIFNTQDEALGGILRRA
jgi:hypothetical protein